VGATTIKKQVASYSLWGSVDVVAPGGDDAGKILSTNAGGGFGVLTGTSPAAAHVSAAVALALQKEPTLSVDKVVALLQKTAQYLKNVPPEQQGAGLIDAQRLVDKLK
jgi:subtilisin family serine protease